MRGAKDVPHANPIKQAIEKVPGGMMVVPLAAGARMATFFPDRLDFSGSFAVLLLSGALTILVAAAVIVTTVLVPLLTAWTARRFGSAPRPAPGPVAAE